MAQPTSCVKRLLSDWKELQKCPLVGASAEPLPEDMLTWYGLIVMPDGNYKGVPIPIQLEFPADYPNSPPKGFYLCDFAYQGGARMTDDKGRIGICLDLFGNFRAIHTEWGKDASGWSPSYTVSSILVSMLALMQSDMVAQDAVSVGKTAQSARSYKNRVTGHDGSDSAKWFPKVHTNESLKAALASMSPEEKMSDPLADHYLSYADKETVASGAVLGYGISIEGGRVKKLSSPCEYLSFEAFSKQGIRASTLNKEFKHWLPIYITKDHWAKSGTHWQQSMLQIAAELNIRVYPQAVLGVCASLMNSMVVEVSKPKNNLTANDKFIDGYIALLQLLLLAKQQTPDIEKLANTRVAKFLASSDDRSKDACPDLGEFLIYVLASKYKWQDVASAFVEENDTRNVFWYIQGTGNSPGAHPELSSVNPVASRAEKVFGATATSRTIVAFQARFMQLAASLTFDDISRNCGLPSDAIRNDIKKAYAEIVAFKNWDHYFAFIGMPSPSYKERTTQLENAVKLSLARGYHKEGGQRQGGYGGGHGGYGGGRGGYGGGYRKY